MGVNIVDFTGSQPGFVESHLHGPNGAVTTCIRLGNMVGIPADSVSNDFRQDIYPPFPGKGQVLQDKCAGLQRALL